MARTPIRRIPKDDDRYPHGTYSGYVAGCRCDDCEAGKRKYKAEHAAARRRGELVLVPADDVTAHLRSLLESVPGAMPATLSNAAGVALSSMVKLANGTQKRCTAEVRRAVLRTTPRMVERDLHEMRPAKKTRQLWYSMLRQGWNGQWICRQAGYPASYTAPAFVNRGYERVSLETHRRIAAVAAEVGDSWGPSFRAQAIAERRGWHPLNRYDDLGDLLPEPDSQHAEEAALLADPDSERRGREWAALRRLFALRAMLVEGMAPTPAVERYSTTLATHWRHLHVRLAGTPYTHDRGSTLVPPTEDQQPFVDVIRRYIDAIPVLDSARVLGEWEPVNVPLSYDPQAAQQALYADLAVLCDARCPMCAQVAGKRWEAQLGVTPGTWSTWLTEREAPAGELADLKPEAVTADVVKLRPGQNRTPWRTEAAVTRRSA